MKLLTVVTHSERYYPYLTLSAKNNGHELITLGWGQKWQGFAWKFQLMKEYLETLSTDEIICFVDGYDVLVLEDPVTIEAKFKNAIGNDRRKVLVSKEQAPNGFFNTTVSYLSNLIFMKCKGESINSGTYIGYSSGILNILNGISREFDFRADLDDQAFLQKYCVLYQNEIAIDSDSNIFLVVNSPFSNFKEKDYNITYTNKTLLFKGNTVSFFHGNGYTNFDSIIEHLGYDTTLFRASDRTKIQFIWSRFWEYFRVICIGIIVKSNIVLLINAIPLSAKVETPWGIPLIRVLMAKCHELKPPLRGVFNQALDLT